MLIVKRYITSLVLIIIVATNGFSQGSNSINVLVISNADYAQPKWTMRDISFSANAFLSCFKDYCTPCILESSANRILDKKKILQTINSFVSFVNNQNSHTTSIGIIYYCGHGIASLQGSQYLIPGDLESNAEDVTFGFLSKKMISVDEILSIINKSQFDDDTPNSRFMLLTDCCNNIPFSKWYKDISYYFQGDTIAIIKYDSSAIMNLNQSRSVLKYSSEA